jgi:predicted MFS family arabinose efflux permease
MAEEAAAPGTSTEAGAWVNTAYNLGNAAGTACVGLLLARLSLSACFAVAAAPLLVPIWVTFSPGPAEAATGIAGRTVAARAPEAATRQPSHPEGS